jgi:hypothetical protein
MLSILSKVHDVINVHELQGVGE